MRFKIIREIEIDTDEDVSFDMLVNAFQESDRQDLNCQHQVETEVGKIIEFDIYKVNTQVIKL